jgi:uncharacterized protein YeaO (DUF488 family)
MKTETTGRLRGTYHAALQHGHDEPADDDLVLAVVDEQMYGIQKYTDEHWPVLAPPTEALHEFKARADEIGHNEAVDELGFDTRYRDHVRRDKDVHQAIDAVIDKLESGQDVWLVCYENTDEKFCHRTVLREEIKNRLNEVGATGGGAQ